MQEVFNIVYKHLLTQNAVALVGWDNKLRTSDGKKCAIGCLLSDEVCDYFTHLGGRLWTPAFYSALVTAGIPVAKDNQMHLLLDDLRRIHDKVLIIHWPQHLENVAAYYQLTLPV